MFHSLSLMSSPAMAQPDCDLDRHAVASSATQALMPGKSYPHQPCKWNHNQWDAKHVCMCTVHTNFPGGLYSCVKTSPNLPRHKMLPCLRSHALPATCHNNLLQWLCSQQQAPRCQNAASSHDTKQSHCPFNNPTGKKQKWPPPPTC